jgi:hypothetical protein
LGEIFKNNQILLNKNMHQFPILNRVKNYDPSGESLRDRDPSGESLRDRDPSGESLRDRDPSGESLRDRDPLGSRSKRQTKPQNSFVVILALLTLTFLLLTGAYFSISVLTEMKISDSYIKASQAYYLAEAGVNEAIWKLRNDDTTTDGDQAWKTQFVTQPGCENFTDSFTRQNALYPNSSYNVTITDSEIIFI